MSAVARDWAWQQTLKGNLFVVLLALADLADKEGVCWASKITIIRKTNLSDRGLMGLVRKLVDRGFVKIEMRFRPNGSQTSNRYVLNLGGEALCVLPPLAHTCSPPEHMGAPPIEPVVKPVIEPKDCGEPQEDNLSTVAEVTSGDKKTRSEIFENAKRKNEKLTPDGCASLWRNCRASAGENGFQAEILVKEKKMLCDAYQRVGESYPEIVWACMENWVAFTKHAESTAGAFNCPLVPQVSFFTKYVESAADFTQSNQNSQDEGFVQLTATPKTLTKPNVTGDNTKDAVTADELAAISEKLYQ